MNLTQIEKRFECIEFMANYVNYKYNPSMPKVEGLQQHIHKDLMKQDANYDQSIYGRAAFVEGDPTDMGRSKSKVIQSPTQSKVDNVTSDSGVAHQKQSREDGEAVGNTSFMPDQTGKGNIQITDTSAHLDYYKLNRQPLGQGRIRPQTSAAPKGSRSAASLKRGSKFGQSTLINRGFSGKAKSNHIIHRSKVQTNEFGASRSQAFINKATSGFYKQKNSTLQQPLHARLGQVEKLPQGGRYIQDVTPSIDKSSLKLDEQGETFDNLVLSLYKIKIPDQILGILQSVKPFQIQIKKQPQPENRADHLKSEAMASTERVGQTRNASLHVDQVGLSVAQHLQAELVLGPSDLAVSTHFRQSTKLQQPSTMHRSDLDVTSPQSGVQIGPEEIKDQQKSKTGVPPRTKDSDLSNKVQGALRGTSSVPELESCAGQSKSNTPAPSTPDIGPQVIQQKQQIISGVNDLASVDYTPLAKEPSTAKLDPTSNKAQSLLKMTQPKAQSHVISIVHATKSPPIETQTNGSAPQYTENINTPLQPKNLPSGNSKFQEATPQRFDQLVKSGQSNLSQKIETDGQAITHDQGAVEEQKTLTDEVNILSGLNSLEAPLPDQESQELKNFVKVKRESKHNELLFNLKLTDLTTTNNPFVVFENRKIDENGYLLFQDDSNQEKNLSQHKRNSQSKCDNDDKHFQSLRSSELGESDTNNNMMDPAQILPWLSKASDLEKRTLKIEVTYQGELILLRIIHLDKLYPIQYPKIALQIANNMVQNHMLRQEEAQGKNSKGTNPLNHEDKLISPLNSTTVLNSQEYAQGTKVVQRESTERVANQESTYNSRMTHLQFISNQQTMRDLQESDEKSQPLSVKKGVTSVALGVNGTQSHKLSKNNNESNRLSQNSELARQANKLSEKGIILETKKRQSAEVPQQMLQKISVSKDQAYYQVNPQPNDMLNILQEVETFKTHITQVQAKVQAARLLKFPEIMQNLKLIIEFSDCILQAEDLLNYNIIIDDNLERAREAKQSRQAEHQKVPMSGLAGVRIAPTIVAENNTRIIREPSAKNANRFSPERTQEIKMFAKNKEANFYILKQTQQNLNQIRNQMRMTQPISALDMKNKSDQFHHLLNKSMFTRQIHPMQKPIDQRPIYHSSKHKGRPVTGFTRGRYPKVESAKTLGSELGATDNQYEQSMGVINYGQLVATVPLIDSKPNSLHRFMKRSEHKKGSIGQHSNKRGSTNNIMTIGSAFKVESSNQCGGSDQEPLNIKSHKEGVATGEGTPQAAGLGYSFGKRSELGTQALQSMERKAGSDQDLSSNGQQIVLTVLSQSKFIVKSQMTSGPIYHTTQNIDLKRPSVPMGLENKMVLLFSPIQQAESDGPSDIISMRSVRDSEYFQSSSEDKASPQEFKPAQLVENFMRRREKKELEKSISHLQILMTKHESNQAIKTQIRAGKVQRKLFHKSKLQSKALWAVFNLYEGEIPTKQVLATIARELCLDRRVIQKWFWDKNRFLTKERQEHAQLSSSQHDQSRSLSDRSEIAINLLKQVKRDEFDQKRGVSINPHIEEVQANYRSEKEDFIRSYLQINILIIRRRNRFIDVDDGIQELADELGLPISQMAMQIVEQDIVQQENDSNAKQDDLDSGFSQRMSSDSESSQLYFDIQRKRQQKCFEYLVNLGQIYISYLAAQDLQTMQDLAPFMPQRVPGTQKKSQGSAFKSVFSFKGTTRNLQRRLALPANLNGFSARDSSVQRKAYHSNPMRGLSQFDRPMTTPETRTTTTRDFLKNNLRNPKTGELNKYVIQLCYAKRIDPTILQEKFETRMEDLISKNPDSAKMKARYQQYLKKRTIQGVCLKILLYFLDDRNVQRF